MSEETDINPFMDDFLGIKSTASATLEPEVAPSSEPAPEVAPEPEVVVASEPEPEHLYREPDRPGQRGRGGPGTRVTVRLRKAR